MAIDRRTLLRGLPSAVALPYLLRSNPAHTEGAAITITQVGAPIELGASQPGGKSGVALAAFTNGTYATGWINTQSFTDARAFVQRRNRNGSVASPIIQMGGGALTDGISAFNLAIVAFPNNTSLVFFSAQRNGATQANALDIFVQRMSASFQKVGAPIAVNTSLAGPQTGVMATLLSNGNVQVVWESAPGGFGSPSIIRGRVIKPNGQPATPERTVIRQTTGFSTPRALAPGQNGGSVLAYTRIFNTASPEGAAFVEKGIQQLTVGGVVTLPYRNLDTAIDGRQFGAPGLQWGGPGNTDPSVYVSLFEETSDVSEFHRFDLRGSSPPTDDFIRNLRVPPSFRGAPQGANVEYYMVDYDFVALHTETPAGANTLTAMLLRQNGAIAAQKVFGPFAENFLNPTAGIFLLPAGNMPLYVLGYAKGNDLFSDRAWALTARLVWPH